MNECVLIFCFLSCDVLVFYICVHVFVSIDVYMWQCAMQVLSLATNKVFLILSYLLLIIMHKIYLEKWIEAYCFTTYLHVFKFQ